MASLEKCQFDSIDDKMACLNVNSDIKNKSRQIFNIQINNKTTKDAPKMSPATILLKLSNEWNIPIESEQFAKELDQEDHLSKYRNMFVIPKKSSLPNIDPNLVKDPEEECIYLCGQSLGLKPKKCDENVQKVLTSWSENGVHSHFHGYLPAALSDLPPKKPMSKIVGAKEHEIAILNGLTVNLHLLLATFYRPNEERYKIIIEDHAFPSDTYVAKSQLRSHGISPEEGLILLKPRKDEYLLNEDDILKLIEEEGGQVKVALFPAVQYYTGQLLDVKKLTEAAHRKGIIVGIDLAHAVGNVPVELDEWNVDFAAWCTYKYLNSGAGGMGAIYINEKFFGAANPEKFPMYQGWWGNNNKTKFMMKETFDPANGADMFKLSNPSPVLNAMLMSSLDTSIRELRTKQFLLTGYLEFMIKSFFPAKTNKDSSRTDRLMPSIEIITPGDPEKRGCQLSLMFSLPLSVIQEQFQKRGIVCDIRMPSVMRVAPTPLYNSFLDIFKFITTLYDIFKNMNSFDLTAINEDSLLESFEIDQIEDAHSSLSSDSEVDSLAGTNTL